MTRVQVEIIGNGLAACAGCVLGALLVWSYGTEPLALPDDVARPEPVPVLVLRLDGGGGCWHEERATSTAPPRLLGASRPNLPRSVSQAVHAGPGGPASP